MAYHIRSGSQNQNTHLRDSDIVKRGRCQTFQTFTSLLDISMYYSFGMDRAFETHTFLDSQASLVEEAPQIWSQTNRVKADDVPQPERGTTHVYLISTVIIKALKMPFIKLDGGRS